MILQFPKPYNLSRENYVLLAHRNAKAQNIRLEPQLEKELLAIIQKRIQVQANKLDW